MDLTAIKNLVLDVDGVLTPGDVSFDERGARVMSFNIHDGLAIARWIKTGCRAAILSGRDSPIVARRAAELGIETVIQGAPDKQTAFQILLDKSAFAPPETAAIGDDLPDLPVLNTCAFAVAVADAVPTVKRQVDYVTLRPGGRGAVAEVIELILRSQNRWDRLVGGA
jgi:3-deoxy-D-manno-octulosonate 8-phosphate phosphatase (KDO 8-P phosphatase)